MSPHVIRLWFSEKPELSLTKVTLSDSGGTRVPLGAPAPDVDGPLAVSIPIPGALAAGRYTVSWSTAAADGHPSKGHVTFRVIASSATVPAVAFPSAATSAATPVARGTIPSRTAPATTGSEDAAASVITPAFVAVRTISFAALLAMIGAAAFRFGVLPRTEGLDAATKSAIATTIASRCVVAAGLFLLASLARLYLQNRMMTGDLSMDAAHMRAMSMGTNWGAAWRFQFGAGALALVAFLLAQRTGTIGWALVAPVIVALALATAVGGHAGASERLPALAVLDDCLHILAAAGWMGSLLWMAVAGVPIIQSSSEGRAQRAAALVHAFSPVALGCAALVGTTGIASAWLRLGDVSALWSTSYGQLLLVKLALLLALAATGFHNWRRVRPSLGTDDATARLERSAAIELGIGLLVIIVTAILVATSTPT